MATDIFYCKLKDCPEIPVRAPGKYEAQETYFKFCGVLDTINKLEIRSVAEMTGPDKTAKDPDAVPTLDERRLAADKLAKEKRWDVKA
jgi:hypothetical protein